MQTLHSRILIEGLIFPEGIRWHQGRLWFSDILDFKIYSHDPGAGRTDVVATTQDRPSGLGFLPDDSLLIATMGERQLLRLGPNGLETHADLKPRCNLLNDMVVDTQGRAYVDAHFTDERGGLIMVEPTGRYRIVADDMKSPNGLAITADGKTLIVNDLFAYTITAFDITEQGSLTHQRMFAKLDGDSPDGLCLDAEGAAWVGLPFQGKFRRFKPGGEVTHEIACANKWGIAPVLGGPDRRTLFLCTAEVTIEEIVKLMRDPRDARKTCKGWIEAVEGIAVPGAGRP
jgi:sugar lactone lactonase YvrE